MSQKIRAAASDGIRGCSIGPIVALLLIFSLSILAGAADLPSAGWLDRPLHQIHLRERGFPSLMFTFAKPSVVPFGYEQSYKEAAALDEIVELNVDEGSILDALNEIVARKPGYRWSEHNGTVRIVPQSSDLLSEVRIAHFVMRDERLSEGWSRLVDRPEISIWCKDHNLVLFTLYDNGLWRHQTQLAKVSLDLKNATLGSILDRIALQSGSNHWIIERLDIGDEKYMSIRF